MSVDIEFLGETWLAVKEYIPSKERQAAADHLVSLIADQNISDRDLKTLSRTDSYFRRAIEEYLDEDESDSGQYDDE